MRVGILTGGGDCPGLNAVIRAVTRKGIVNHGFDILGIKNGWLGLIEGKIYPLDLNSISGILPRGGTILGTSRTNPFRVEDGVGKIFSHIEKFEIDAVIAIGGEDTLGVAKKLSDKGLRCVGVPKTIDNDLSGTDYTFGFDTAVSVVAEALDRLHTTAEAHHRVMVVEVMGRHAGWIAVEGGLAGGADIILIPEFPFDLNEICAQILKRRERGKLFSIVVAAEGAKPQDASLITQTSERDAFGHVRLGGIGNMIAREIEMRTGIDTRVTVLGHIQRGGSPTAFDRILATRYGIAAIDLVKDEKFGLMVGLKGNRIVAVPLEEALAEPKTVDADLYDMAKVFFG
ncbi:MAG TPA: 6-phosphofructokinase [Candidatus Aminicenantes bacterium]|nr:6-phosphofructokinase [Candidatus Aminicenantes bacterium]HRY65410.1 6-phosphofructokinase [Candidatus Aminicenantes bacterium]HRZ72122.1 6-phosphofructokinase [Candidatus Aminicenantes bacterium]